MTEPNVAKKAMGRVRKCIYVSHPDETAMVYIRENSEGEGYEGWLDTVYDEKKSREYRGALDLSNGDFRMYSNDTIDLAVKLMNEARSLGFKYAQVYELTDNPVDTGISVL